MATNPMQKKSRNAFLLGMLIMLIVAALVVALLYMKIKNQKQQLDELGKTQKVYVITKNVNSGDVLELGVNYALKDIQTKAVPTGAITSATYNTVFDSFKFTDSTGRNIYVHLPDSTDKETYYYLETPANKLYRVVYDQVTRENKEQVVSDNINVNDKLYYKADNRNNEITVKDNAIVAKVNMGANTVLTSNLINRADQITTNDLRKEEYNVISLPVDLAPGEYIDVRLLLPNGQNYIVTSKKKVTIPVVNGQYLSDTIQMDLTEEEILMLSCAIVENYQMNGSKLYASRYTEAGMQDASNKTYQPNDYVINLIKNDSNIVTSAIKGLNSRGIKDIDDAVRNQGNEENIQTKSETSIQSTQDQRKNYLLSLPVTQ